jgi:hypothetical protein
MQTARLHRAVLFVQAVLFALEPQRHGQPLFRAPGE